MDKVPFFPLLLNVYSKVKFNSGSGQKQSRRPIRVLSSSSSFDRNYSENKFKEERQSNLLMTIPNHESVLNGLLKVSREAFPRTITDGELKVDPTNADLQTILNSLIRGSLLIKIPMFFARLE